MRKYGMYEPLYLPGQQLSSDAFLPFEIRDNRAAAWREFRILVDMYRDRTYLKHAATGLFSPKFALKSKITAGRFIEFVDTRPDCDLWFINPFPQLAYWSFNVWMQGEHAHPGLQQAAQSLLDASGISWQLSDVPRQGNGILSYCNFWVGSPRFWEAYVGQILLPISDFLENNPDHPVSRSVMRDTTHTDPAPFLPFIIERLFSTYLSLNSQCAVASYDIPYGDIASYCINDFERLLVRKMQPLVDSAETSGVFDQRLIDQMDFICAIWQQHFFDLYAQKPHPHTGRLIDPPV
ncbi:hypothetical protein [Paraburkholderia sp. D1E]|uniref:hypothetical protein n=1 Tax=Paraburkholderia sp. D1E TaxID=3461398 RepID=UPI0040456017